MILEWHTGPEWRLCSVTPAHSVCGTGHRAVAIPIQLLTYYASTNQFNQLKTYQKDPSFRRMPVYKVYDLKLNPKYKSKEKIQEEIDRLTASLEAWELKRKQRPFAARNGR